MASRTDSFEGRTALITGASGGIGAAFARAFAARGVNLVLVARSKEKLDALAADVRDTHAVRVDVIPTDLSIPTQIAELEREVKERGLQIDILVNNAGFATYGRFDEMDAHREQKEVAVNMAALVDLTHAFLPGMLVRRRGTVINLASVVAFQAVPYMAVYSASKAFVLHFTEALAAEHEGSAVQFLALCPGATRTAFWDFPGQSPGVEKMRTPEQVVETAFKALAKDKVVAIDGTANVIRAFGVRLLPRKWLIRIAEATFRPKPPA